MGKNAKDNRPLVKPVRRIELDQKHFPLRIVLFVVLLVFGVSAIAYAISQLLTDRSGWQTIVGKTEDGAHCGDEFTLRYQLGADGGSANAEYRALAELYGQATATAYRVFAENQIFDGLYNVAYLNANPGQTVEVDEVLYDALKLCEQADTRQLFLAPIYEYYANLFSCTEDEQTVDYDPAVNSELADLFAEILEYTNDPDSISIQLLSDHRVCLRISEEYLAFAGTHDIYTFVSFHWMKNAFIADYLADTLCAAGYTHGMLASYDGFSRNLDDRGTSYAVNLFEQVDGTLYQAGTMPYCDRLSLVLLRTFPINQADNDHYYMTQAGEIRFPYIDAADGRCRAAESNLLCYSSDKGCAEILLRMIPVYIADTLDLASLSGTDIGAIFCKNGVIFHTEQDPGLVDLSDGYTTRRIAME